MSKGWIKWMYLGVAVMTAFCWLAPTFAQEAAETVEAAAMTPEQIEAEVTRLNAEIPAVLKEQYYYSAGDEGPVLHDLDKWRTNNLWVLIAAFLVFIMHLGFAMVESGLTRAKNTVNILFKNTLTPAIGLIMYAICGWLIMYPGDNWIIPGWFAFGFGIGGEGVYKTAFEGTAYATSQISPEYNAGYTMWTDFLFQGMFAATCATIVSGAVAERIKLSSYLVFTIVFAGLVYPVIGSWKWGGGWLADLGFADFAGSTLVHAVGGAAALAGILILGPRVGKYAADGSVQPIPGHSLPMATIGVFLLWFGWFGFNGGSELSADPAGISYVCMTTAMAGAGGAVGATLISWIFGGKPDLSMALNGILAGLVGITAGPDVPSWLGATVICGIIPGVIVYFAVLAFDKIGIDDPVGALSVHGVCGIYGTLAVAFSGIFEGNVSGTQFVTQAIGTISAVVVSFIAAAVIFLAIKYTIGLRVSQAEEIEGLDLGEHDMSAYPDFQRTYIKSYHAREI